MWKTRHKTTVAILIFCTVHATSWGECFVFLYLFALKLLAGWQEEYLARKKFVPLKIYCCGTSERRKQSDGNHL